MWLLQNSEVARTQVFRENDQKDLMICSVDSGEVKELQTHGDADAGETVL